MSKDLTEYNRQYYQRNREKILANVKKYYQKNGEKKKAYWKIYCSKPENIKKRQKYHRECAQRPEFKEADKKRKQRIKDWYRKYHLEYYHRNKDRINEQRGVKAVLKRKKI